MARYSPADRLRVVRDCERMDHSQVLAYLALAGVSWGAYSQWRRRYREHGAAGLADRPMGRPRARHSVGSRLAELERRVEALESR